MQAQPPRFYTAPTMYARLLVLVSSFAASALAYSSPPSGAITVGSGGDYSSLSEALEDTSSSVSTANRTMLACQGLTLPSTDVLHLRGDLHGHRYNYTLEHQDLRADGHRGLVHRKQCVVPRRPPRGARD